MSGMVGAALGCWGGGVATTMLDEEMLLAL